MSLSNDLFQDIFTLQKANLYHIANSSAKQRIKKLKMLKRAVEITYRDAIIQALKEDLAKPTVEAELTEIYPIISEIKHVKRHLKSWMTKKRVATPLSMLGASSYYKYQSKGVCLIISPWNFPFNLTFGPLISAIAAGNTAIIKPSEMSPACSAVMAEIITSLFNKNEIALIEGEVNTATALLKLPFNHIFFTGSPAVGKIVMRAASMHLASVTLELGGKSPTIVDETAQINKAAKKIVWGKFLNCGQTCIAPDYVLVNSLVKDMFVEACKYWIAQYFSSYPHENSSYGRIVNSKHYKRLKGYLTDAENQNAKIEIGNKTDAHSNYIAPTTISNLNTKAPLLNEEIFGPILPIVTYQNLNEAIAFINEKPSPLALYIYSKSSKNISIIINNTKAGGTCINNNVLQYGNLNLPFGGVNNSGIGSSHGFFGFEAFSNKRAIVKQHTVGIAELLFPPYSKFKERLAKITVKWL